MSTFPEHDLPSAGRRGQNKIKNNPEEQRRARLTVARAADNDLAVCAQLLEMLGLVPDGMKLTVRVP